MKKLISTSAVLLLSIPSIFAATVSNLYEVNVPVVDQSAATQERAFEIGLSTVLVRVSGNSQVMNVSGLQAVIPHAANYVDQFSYNAGPNNTSVMDIKFSANALNDLLRQQQIPKWSMNRPLTVIWLTSPSLGASSILSSTALSNPVLQQLNQNANLRGLPIVVPAMDTVDTQKMSSKDIVTDNSADLQSASIRYGANAIVAVNLNDSNPTAVTSLWYLLSQGTAHAWQINGNSVDGVIARGIGQVADTLAQTVVPSVATNAQQTVSLNVNQVTDMQNIAKIQHYLASLSGVKNVELGDVEDNMAVFNVTVSSGVAALLNQIQLSSLLQPTSQNLTFQYNATA